MLKNNLKVALRALVKNKTYTIINVLGLAIGITACLFIFRYAQYELSYDQYHQKKKQIFRLVNNNENLDEGGIAKVAGPWGPMLQDEFPEVKEAIRFCFFGTRLVSHDDTKAYESGGFYADENVFKVFDYPWISGNPETALSSPNTLVITQKMAKKYFGNDNPLGKTLTFDHNREMLITGVIEDIPKNSHFTFPFLASMNTDTTDLRYQWNRNQHYTYLLLTENASLQHLSHQFDKLLNNRAGEADIEAHTSLQPLADIHLHSNLFREIEENGSLSQIRIFITVAVMILLLACINFINLSTVQATTRAKEVGIRKMNGALRFSLIRQFLGEALLLSFFATCLAIALAELLMPVYQNLIGQALRMNYFQNHALTISIIGVFLFTGLAAGSYPAWVISGFQPARALKAEVKLPGNIRLRESLVVFQFCIAAILIIAILVVQQQRNFIQTKELGFNKEQIVNFSVQNSSLLQNFQSFKNELLTYSGIEKVSLSANLPGGGDWGIPTQPEGIPEDEIPPIRMLVVDEDFIDTYQINIVEGRNFSESMPTDITNAYLINKEAARQLGWEGHAIGKQIGLPVVNKTTGPIIGVVEDFHFRSLHETIQPLLFFMRPEWLNTVSVRIRAENPETTLAFIAEKWKEFDAETPFVYTFLDESFAQLYAQETRASQIMNYATGIAMLIAFMGLFGLVAFTSRRRRKEIGIRKVLGASAPGIMILLSKDFTKLVGIAFLVAVPLAYYAMHSWLSAFAYRTTIGIGTFIMAGLMILLITWTTVGFQSLKVALVRPVESLKNE